jgi:hypothetical protein
MPDEFRTVPEADAHSPGIRGIPWRHSILLRTPVQFARRLSRMAERLQTEDKDYFLRPPVIVNSFPCSGGRLLLQLTRAFPETRWYGSTVASLPTIPFRERSDVAHDRLIRRIVPGEILRAHLFFNDGHARRIAALNGVHLFLQRDLRDVAVAEAHQLTYVKYWHRLHPFFAGLKNDAQRISVAIRGFAHPRFPYHYPNIAHRFARYHGWLNRYDVVCVAFEDLYSERFEDAVRAMAHAYSRLRRTPLDEESVARDARRIIAIERSGVPQVMAPGSWIRMFKDEHHRQFEEIAGDLNRRLGYPDAPGAERPIPQTSPPERASSGANRSGVVPLFPRRGAVQRD